MPARYLRLRFQVESGGEDLLSAELWRLGTLGLEIGRDSGDRSGSLVAYFEPGAPLDGVAWERHGGRLVDCECFAERDWLAAYRRRAEPIAVGRTLLIDPGEPGATPERRGAESSRDGRRLLRLPARTAFGTGSHASTRLAVELMEGLDLGGLAVLDVGCGSGILSFAAELAGAAPVVGVEIDCQAALVAVQNRRLNRLRARLIAGGVAALRPAPLFDLALVNVLPKRVEGDLGAIRRRLRRGGRAIFSGLVEENAASVVRRLEEHRFEPLERRSSGEWVAFLTAASAAGGGE